MSTDLTLCAQDIIRDKVRPKIHAYRVFMQAGITGSEPFVQAFQHQNSSSVT
jgi:hypothetical protein